LASCLAKLEEGYCTVYRILNSFHGSHVPSHPLLTFPCHAIGLPLRKDSAVNAAESTICVQRILKTFPPTSFYLFFNVPSDLLKLLRGIFYFIFFCTSFNTASSAILKMLGSNPGQMRLRHWLSDSLTTRLDLILTRLDLIHTRLDLIVET
jgi:hypothetical protein